MAAWNVETQENAAFSYTLEKIAFWNVLLLAIRNIALSVTLQEHGSMLLLLPSTGNFVR